MITSSRPRAWQFNWRWLGGAIGLGLILLTSYLLVVYRELIFADVSSPLEAINLETGSDQPTTKRYELRFNRYGEAVIDGRSISKALQPLIGRDEFRYKLLDKPGEYFERIIIDAHFAKPLAPDSEFDLLAIHGVDRANAIRLDDQTVRYQAEGIGPEATLTLVATLPSGSFDWPWGRLLIGYLLSAPLTLWLVLAGLLPLTGLIVLFVLAWPLVRGVFLAPPRRQSLPERAELSPAVVGLLWHGRITLREVAATILDLLWRGYLSLNFAQGQFKLIKRRALSGLTTFEQSLLQAIFASQQQVAATPSQIEAALNQNLFSHQVALAYLTLYDQASQAKLFLAHPALTHRRYQATGLSLVVVGLLLFAWAIMVELKPSGLLLPLAATIGLGLIILLVAPRIPLLTDQGVVTRAAWQNRRDLLSQKQPIGAPVQANATLEYWLPYALALGVEKPWIERFTELPYAKPDWFETDQDQFDLATFTQELLTWLSALSQQIEKAKEPDVI